MADAQTIRSAFERSEAALKQHPTAGDDQTLEATGPAGASVTLGTHAIALTVTDPVGESDTDSVTVAVVDTTPPGITVCAGPATLWPPNHKYHAVALSTLGLPWRFALEGNYPNPFSGRTTIGYALPEAARVRLAVYDLLGRRVAVLVDEEQATGRQEVVFDAVGLPSGVYFVRLEAGGFSATRRLVLVR